jgi:hypothetical protein
MAAAERIDRGYLGRMLQLTLLAPPIVEKILDGRQPPELGLPGLMEPLPAEWSQQGQALPATGRRPLLSEAMTAVGFGHERQGACLEE